eukprot:scaffold77070_cov30-Prasinocladus_malaysianus.AAC.1
MLKEIGVGLELGAPDVCKAVERVAPGVLCGLEVPLHAEGGRLVDVDAAVPGAGDQPLAALAEGQRPHPGRVVVQAEAGHPLVVGRVGQKRSRVVN